MVVSQMCSNMHWVMMHLLLFWCQAGLVWQTQTFFFVVHCGGLLWCITYFWTNSFAYLIYLSMSWLQQLGWDQIASNPAACEGSWTIAYWTWIYCSCFGARTCSFCSHRLPIGFTGSIDCIKAVAELQDLISGNFSTCSISPVNLRWI